MEKGKRSGNMKKGESAHNMELSCRFSLLQPNHNFCSLVSTKHFYLRSSMDITTTLPNKKRKSPVPFVLHSPAADNLQTLLPLRPHLQQITQIPSNLLPHVSLCLRSQSQQKFPENMPAKQTREVSRSGK